MLAGGGTVSDDSDIITGLGSVSRGGSSGGRSVICEGEDGTSGIRGLERRGARGNDSKLKVDGCRRVPPLWLEESLVRTARKIDIFPGMDARGCSTGCVEEYVDVGGVKTGGIPSHVDSRSVLERLGSRRGDVKPAGIAS